MNILFIGHLREGLTGTQRMLALAQLGHGITSLDLDAPRATGAARLTRAITRRLGFSADESDLNARLREAARGVSYDLLWLDKVLCLKRRTLEYFRSWQRRCVVAFYTPDDMMNRANWSRCYHSLLPILDIHFTTKSYQVPEIQSWGCRNVHFIGNAFAPEHHRPWALTEAQQQKWGVDVGFFGGFEKDRARQILALAQSGQPVRVIGDPGWRQVPKHPLLSIHVEGLFGEDYGRVICATKINLCFLRKVNRDLQTTRSVEIPACAAFMLGERTQEHLALFTEGVEAEFFGCFEELREKVRFYLANPSVRERIARAGYERCQRSGYSNQTRLQEMLRKVTDSTGNGP